MRLSRFVLIGLLAAVTLAYAASAASAKVWRVGTYNGVGGQFTSIQAAVNAAKSGDWILVGPGDYKEQATPGAVEPAGVLITKANIHLRGMNRNTVVVDGTRPGTPQCSSQATDQGPVGRDGVEVYKANNTWIENLTVCNFLNGGSGEGNQIWWNGGDGSGQISLNGFWGNYLTATSSYSSSVPGAFGPCCGVNYPAGDYGIFSSNSTNGWFKNSYASNMADAAYYIGACQQECNQVMQYDQGENSSLCLSSTNAGGYLLVENNVCDNNKTGLVSNSQNNDDFPSPQIGLCPPGQTGPLGTQSCTVWMQNNIHDNNNPNVPGNGSGLSGAGPVGTGMVLAGSTYITLSGNTVTNNGAWGELITDLPDQEAPAPNNPHPCQGGIYAPINGVQTCYYQAYGNVSENNQFSGNGGFHNPTNGDIGLSTAAHNPGNCFSGDSVPDGTDPAGIETNPLYQPTNGMCQQANSGDLAVLGPQVACASQIVGPCPNVPAATSYPRPAPTFPLPPVPSTLPSMPNPCSGVPKNPWCP
jgi:parallel beta-helix repeat protein